MKFAWSQLTDFVVPLALSFTSACVLLGIARLALALLEPTKELAYVHDWADDVRFVVFLSSLVTAFLSSRCRSLSFAPNVAMVTVVPSIGATSERPVWKQAFTVMLFLVTVTVTNLLGLALLQSNTYGACDFL